MPAIKHRHDKWINRAHRTCMPFSPHKRTLLMQGSVQLIAKSTRRKLMLSMIDCLCIPARAQPSMVMNGGQLHSLCVAKALICCRTRLDDHITLNLVSQKSTSLAESYSSTCVCERFTNFSGASYPAERQRVGSKMALQHSGLNLIAA
eukprot:1696576-Amphidinium_carterae.1